MTSRIQQVSKMEADMRTSKSDGDLKVPLDLRCTENRSGLKQNMTVSIKSTRRLDMVRQHL